MQTFDVQNKFGVTLLILDCGFSAELRRDTIYEAMTAIEQQLTQQGAPDDRDARVELIMGNASSISIMVANKEIDNEEGVADIAYSFVYALGKTVGFDQLIQLRGLTATFLKNVLSLNPCLGDHEYDQETATLTRLMADTPDDGDEEWDIAPRLPPTLH